MDSYYTIGNHVRNPVSLNSTYTFLTKREFFSNHIEKFVDYLLFLKYHLNNLNAKAKFKCLFIYNLKKFYCIKDLILSVLAACDDCCDFIDNISIKIISSL